MNAIEVLREQLQAHSEGRNYAIATIVTSDGSTPRSNGKMIVYDNGTAHGTIGGGSVELLAIRDAVECIKKGENAYRSYDLSTPASNTGMTCGGSVTVLIEVFSARPLLVMIGAGHVGGAVLKLASFVGYETLLIDDRPDELIADKTALADRFVRVRDFEAEVKAMDIPAAANIVIATHGHAHDGAALAAALTKNAKYLGMIGSRRKIGALFSKLREKGVSDEELSRVYTPIGLDIGGETPEEIALAIMAEIQSVRYGKNGAHLACREK